MSDFTRQKVAYLQGLAEGLEYNQSSKEGQLIKGILEVLEIMAEELNDLDESYQDFEERVETLEENLSDLEDVFYDEGEMEMMDDEEGEEFVQVHCPHCDRIVFLDNDALSETEIKCPACGKAILPEA